MSSPINKFQDLNNNNMSDAELNAYHSDHNGRKYSSIKRPLENPNFEPVAKFLRPNSQTSGDVPSPKQIIDLTGSDEIEIIDLDTLSDTEFVDVFKSDNESHFKRLQHGIIDLDTLSEKEFVDIFKSDNESLFKRLEHDQEVPNNNQNLSEQSSYSGDVNSDGHPHGKGVQVLSNGDRYEGEFLEGVRSGQGKLSLASGMTYEGDFLEGLPHGHGKSVTSLGQTYEGPFKLGKPHGWGLLRNTSDNKSYHVVHREGHEIKTFDNDDNAKVVSYVDHISVTTNYGVVEFWWESNVLIKVMRNGGEYGKIYYESGRICYYHRNEQKKKIVRVIKNTDQSITIDTQNLVRRNEKSPMNGLKTKITQTANETIVSVHRGNTLQFQRKLNEMPVIRLNGSVYCSTTLINEVYGGWVISHIDDCVYAGGLNNGLANGVGVINESARSVFGKFIDGQVSGYCFSFLKRINIIFLGSWDRKGKGICIKDGQCLEFRYDERGNPTEAKVIPKPHEFMLNPYNHEWNGFIKDGKLMWFGQYKYEQKHGFHIMREFSTNQLYFSKFYNGKQTAQVAKIFL